LNTTEDYFQDLSKRFFDWHWADNPVEATAIGFHNYDHRLPDFSPQSITARDQAIQRFLSELKALPLQELPLETRVDYSLLLSLLQKLEREESMLKNYQRNPGHYLSMAFGGIYLLVIRNFAPLDERMKLIRGRLLEIPRLLDQCRNNLKQPPHVFVETELLSLPGIIGFFSYLLPDLAEKTPALKDEIAEACRQTVDALNRFGQFLEGLLDEPGDNFAIGQELFNRMLSEEHFLDYNCETLLTKGLELVAETKEEMEKLTSEIDPSATWEEIIAEAKKVHPSEEDLLDSYRRENEKVKAFVEEKDLVDLPEGELIIEETPEPFRPIIPYAAYLPPAPLDKDKTGRFYVTPVDVNKTASEKEAQLGEHSLYSIPITVLHEGYPGHHLQLCYAGQAPTMLKKQAENTLFIEGWAFYCEQLMEQQGYLKDPRTRMKRLKDQLWRACRIVVDVSLHTGKMTFDEAVDYMVKTALLERNSALTEVRRYAATPTQPMSYLMGKLEIVSIYEDYRAIKGERFNLKDFHHTLLSFGSLPPALIRKLYFNTGDQA